MSRSDERRALLALARFVRDALEEKRLMQRELARRSGLRRELVGRIARGETNTSITAVCKLAQGMDVPLGDLGEAMQAGVSQPLDADDERPV